MLNYPFGLDKLNKFYEKAIHTHIFMNIKEF